MSHVFISYRSNDKVVADQLCSVLERNGQKCWIAPRDIPAGFEWPDAIVTAISDSRLMISLVSQDAYGSRHMARELERADNLRVPILPVRRDATPLEGPFQFFLGNRQWLDLLDASPDDCEQALVKAVRELSLKSSESGAAGSTDGRVSPGPDRAASDGAPERPSRATALPARAGELRAVVTTFVAGVMKRDRALEGIDLAEPRTLAFGFRFLIYLTIASALIHIPAWSALGVQFAHPAFILAVLVEGLVEALASCFVLYAAIRIFGGKAEPRQFFGAFCLLSAFLLLIDVCLAPFQARSISIQSSDIDRFVGGAAALGDATSLGNLAVLLVAGVLSMGLRLVFLAALLKAFRVPSQLGRVRTFCVAALGLALWIIVVLVFSQSFEASLYEAFRRH
jgi:hypothetical protein